MNPRRPLPGSSPVPLIPDPVQRRLRRVRPSHAPLLVDSVGLADVCADDRVRAVIWDRLVVIGLPAGS